MKPLITALICAALACGADAIPSGAKVFVGIADDSRFDPPIAVRADAEKHGTQFFDTSVISALESKRVPLALVKRDAADYLLVVSYGSESGAVGYDVDTYRSTSGRIERGTVTPTQDQYAKARARLIDAKSKAVVWTYSFDKRNKSQQQAASAIADAFAKWIKAAKN